MRVFLLLSGSTNSSLPSNRVWIRNFLEPLRDSGHDVFHMSADEGWSARAEGGRSLQTFSEHVLATFMTEHRRQRFTLAFTYVVSGMLDGAVIEEIKRQGVITCNFSCNNEHQFELVAEISRYFDYNLHSEKSARGKFLGVGANPLWWPMASNPRYFRELPQARSIDASFVGGNYCLRAHYVGQLLMRGVQVHVYGPGWQHGARTEFRGRVRTALLMAKSVGLSQKRSRTDAALEFADHCYTRYLARCFKDNIHPPLSDDELVAMYSRSKVSLGFVEVFEGHGRAGKLLRHLHLRDFEAPMCGACYITGFTEDLPEFFEPDKEVVTYRDTFELADKVQFYLKNPGAAEAIRQAGKRRALAEHTYHKRFADLFNAICK